MEKITKRRFIALMDEKIAKRTDKTPLSTREMYEMFMDILTDELLKGNSVILTSFGGFDLKPHGGHRAGFRVKYAESIEDYLTVKFETSNVFRRRLKQEGQELFDKISSRKTKTTVDDDDIDD